jgi:hypothetical protein
MALRRRIFCSHSGEPIPYTAVVATTVIPAKAAIDR